MYAAWVPLGRLAGAGLLAACAFLLSTPDFRMTAVDILRLLAGRKQAPVCLRHLGSVDVEPPCSSDTQMCDKCSLPACPCTI